MSYDLAVWYPYQPLSDADAGELYGALCDGNVKGVRPHPAVDAFYEELTAKHPEIDTVPDDKIDDHDYCPWSCALSKSAGHVGMACVWSKAEYVDQFVHELACKHGLAVFDPQSGTVNDPDSARSESATRWIQRKPSWLEFWRTLLTYKRAQF